MAGGNDENRGFKAAQDLGQSVISDLGKSYATGPKTYNQPLSTPYSSETMGFLNQGMADVQANRGGVNGQIAAGGWLNGGNPYFENALTQTRNNVSTDVNSTFNANGLWGSDLHAKGLAEGMGNVENNARLGNFENEYARMMGAQGAQQQGTATGLGYSGLLDSKAQEGRLAEYDLFNRQTNAPYEFQSKYLGLLTGGQTAPGLQEQQPWWQTLLGYGANVAGNALSLF